MHLRDCLRLRGGIFDGASLLLLPPALLRRGLTTIARAAASLILGLPVVGRPADVVKVFILAGQSNMAGRAPGEELPDYAAAANVAVDYVCSFSRSGLSDRPEPHRSSGWVALEPAPKHASTPGTHFGPEISLGRTLSARWPQLRIAMIKHGRGGTSLAVDWNPDATTGPQLYRELLVQVRSALARLAADGATAELAAFVWCQGEADTTRPEWADAYEGNLRNLLASIRGDLSSSSLPVLLVLTNDGRLNDRMIAATPVRSAQRRVAASEPNVTLVSGDDLTLLDTVHYDGPAQLNLGRRLAESYLANFTP